MVELVLAGREDEARLSAALRDYLAELSRYYDGAAAPEGALLPYPWLPLYFTDARRRAYLICRGDDWAGFALVNDHSFSGAAGDFTIAEFTIFPPLRGLGLGLSAAQALFARHPGRWRVKFSERNAAGMRFWRRAAAPYPHTERSLPGGERRITIDTAGQAAGNVTI